MACIIYSDTMFLEVLPIAFETSLSSSVSAIHANSAEWFEAWNPSQDSLSITVRMPSLDAQKNAIFVLQRWASENAMLRIVYPERNFDWRCVIESCPLQLDYSVPMKDFTVSFFLLTNSFIASQTSFVYSDVASALFTNDYIQDDIYDSIGEITTVTDETVKKLYDSQTQFDGVKLSYSSWPYVTVTSSRWAYSYTIVFSKDLVKCLSGGQDILMYCEQNYIKRNTSSSTDKVANQVPSPKA